MSFQPQAPIPTSFQVNIVFNDPDSKTCKGSVAPISLDFQDLFLPPVIPADLQLLSDRFLDVIFDQLWDKVLLENLGTSVPQNNVDIKPPLR
jgi:hypothetical protein